MRFLDAILPAPPKKSWSGFGSAWLTHDEDGPPQLPWTTLYGNTPAEPIGSNFVDLASGALQSSGVVSAVEMVRFSVFSEARFQWQRYTNGRPGDLFGSSSLALLEEPWPGGTTGDLLAKMILHADLAGNSYTARVDGELVQLRPDWVDILLAPRMVGSAQMGFKRIGYAYYEQGRRSGQPVILTTSEVAHFAPYPDPLASYRGMSWLSPVVREIMSDKAATQHKLKYFENGATSNMVVTLPKEIDPDDFDLFVEAMDRDHKGVKNAYKTVYLAGGADVTVVGANLQQVDFKATQGAGETRVAAAAGVPAVIVGLSEGLAGSSLNAGNYGAAKRQFADRTMRPLWRNAASSLGVLLDRPSDGSRLTYDARDIAFLREDQKDQAEIASKDAQIIRQLGDGGWDPASIKAALKAGYDWDLLSHSGLIPVQLNPPGDGGPSSAPLA